MLTGVQKGVCVHVYVCVQEEDIYIQIYVLHMESREMYIYINMRDRCVYTWGHEYTHVYGYKNSILLEQVYTCV